MSVTNQFIKIDDERYERKLCEKCGAPLFQIGNPDAFSRSGTREFCGACCDPHPIALLVLRNQVTDEREDQIKEVATQRLVSYGFDPVTLAFVHDHRRANVFVVTGNHTAPKVNAVYADIKCPDHAIVFDYDYGVMTVTFGKKVVCKRSQDWYAVYSAIRDAAYDPDTSACPDASAWYAATTTEEQQQATVRKKQHLINDIQAEINKVRMLEREIAKTERRIDKQVTAYREMYGDDPTVDRMPASTKTNKNDGEDHGNV